LGHRSQIKIVTSEQEERDQLTHQVSRLHEKTTQLEQALEHSRDIGCAMGVLMATEKVTRQCAFDMLRIVSQHQNRKLHIVAADVVETGALPLPERPSA
jgi:AmiR/NasT family two-component response regulator